MGACCADCGAATTAGVVVVTNTDVSNSVNASVTHANHRFELINAPRVSMNPRDDARAAAWRAPGNFSQLRQGCASCIPGAASATIPSMRKEFRSLFRNWISIAGAVVTSIAAILFVA